eukprot:CAMPEP_0117423738 /NCGR_PEP_ID=MMETSP0758-20121206/4294_1 /TAXON_ID=63605 /ORGANISM="Percolomonas cosmopolitus, Strain AE-1 (ATCC 50343)" /LENGTH=347 /DNA_ID=CAMNT_0005207091 /DNA_START=38 /DNA_END=1081 /DNA_ORIENTATION=+
MSSEEKIAHVKSQLKKSKKKRSGDDQIYEDFPQLHSASLSNVHDDRPSPSFSFKETTSSHKKSSSSNKQQTKTPLRQTSLNPPSTKLHTSSKFDASASTSSTTLSPRSSSSSPLRYTITYKIKDIPASARSLTGIGLLPIVGITLVAPFLRGYSSLFLTFGLDYASVILAISSALSMGSLISDLKVLEEKNGPDGDRPGHNLDHENRILRMTSHKDSRQLLSLPRILTSISGITIGVFSLYFPPILSLFVTSIAFLSLSLSDHKLTKLGIYPRWFFLCRLIFFCSIILGSVLLFLMYNVYISLEVLDDEANDKENYTDQRLRPVLSAPVIRALQKENEFDDDDGESF